MLSQIEIYCEDVICLTQNVLQLSKEQFRAICASEEIDKVIEDSESGLKNKEKTVRETLGYNSDEKKRCKVSEEEIASEANLNAPTRYSSVNNNGLATAATCEEEIKDDAFFSYDSDFTSQNSPPQA